MYLETIYSPADVKKLDMAQLRCLAAEMREALLQKISVCGGHFGSNFGMIEATIALHYVFESPQDKIVFDVSHQSYGHKMLTGRKDAYLDPARYSSVSGYTCPAESEHDFFNIGHTSTSISLACGLAKGRDALGGRENVIAVIGDGALCGGEAWEGLNNAWELHSNFIVVLNDNQIAIADNHGGLYRHLQDLRDSDGKAECNLFRAMGYEYLFVKDGNDVEALVDAFTRVRDADHAVLVHICTVKGKGYAYAEADKEDWHWKHPFHIENGLSKSSRVGPPTYDDVGRDLLLEKMKNDPGVITIVAGVPGAIRFTPQIRRQLGGQCVDVGVSEEHAVAMAAGIARRGGKPVFVTDCSFFQRTFDQISQEVCINDLPVTLLVRNASVLGMNDITHLGIFDIPLLSNIPNLVYLAPTNKQEYLAMLDWSLEQTGHPVAIRIPKGAMREAAGTVDSDYSALNRYQMTARGNQVAILALGTFYGLGEQILAGLQQTLGISGTLINPRYITGLDREMLQELQKDHKLVVTLEDGILDGGFGEKIARYYGSTGMRTMNFGLKKEFLDRYVAQEILQANHLTASQAVQDIAACLATI